MRNSRHLRSRRARARIALALCVLWLAGYEVLPWLHIATHAHVGRHHHDASGAIVLDEESSVDDRDLDAEVDEHGAPLHHDDEDAEVDEHGEHVHHAHHHHHGTYSARDTLLRGLEHGRHSLAHHAVATTAPPPVLTQPLPIDRRPTFVFADTAIEPYSFSPGRAVARGPPAAAFES